jgi:hypothetical protein
VSFQETAQSAIHNANGCSESVRADVREQLHTALHVAFQRLNSMVDPASSGLTVGGSSAPVLPVSSTALAALRQLAERVFGELAALTEAGGAPTPISQSASGINGLPSRLAAADCLGDGLLSAGAAAIGHAVSLPAPSGCDGSSGLDSTRSLAAQYRSEAAAGSAASAMAVGDHDASRSSFCSGRSASTSRTGSGGASGRGALRRVTPVLLEAYLPSCIQPWTGVLNNTGVALSAAGPVTEAAGPGTAAMRPVVEAPGVAGVATAAVGAATAASEDKTTHAGERMSSAGREDSAAGGRGQLSATGVAADARPLPGHSTARFAAAGDGLLLGLSLDLPSPHPHPTPALSQGASAGARSHENGQSFIAGSRSQKCGRTEPAECRADIAPVRGHVLPRRLTPQLVPQLQLGCPACAGTLSVDAAGDGCTEVSINVCGCPRGSGSVTSRSSSRPSRRIQPQHVAPAPDASGV